MNATRQSVDDQPLMSTDPLRNKIFHPDVRIQSIEKPGGNTDERPLPFLDSEKVEFASRGPKSSHSSYSNSMLGNGATKTGGNMYRGNTYSLDPSPVGSHSVSSASSLSGGPVEGIFGDQHMARSRPPDVSASYFSYMLLCKRLTL
jgi:hypothetical protein